MVDTVNVLMVCLGNICRSPIAAAVFKHIVKERGLTDEFHCESAGIGSWHVGKTMDARAASTLRKHGVSTEHVARQVSKEDFNKFDYIFGMDEQNIKDLVRLAPCGSRRAKIQLLGDYDRKGTIIHDPYYDTDNSGFEDCYRISHIASENFINKKTNR